MKKVFAIIGLIIGIILILTSLYYYFYIYMVVSGEGGETFDGFGYRYYMNKPNDPYTYRIYLFSVPGLFISSYCTQLLKENDSNKVDKNWSKDEKR